MLEFEPAAHFSFYLVISFSRYYPNYILKKIKQKRKFKITKERITNIN